jgi:hypothetical protein
LLGFADTVAMTAILLFYILLVAVPPLILSRKSHYHPTWRGIECFSCYVLTAIVLGAVFAVTADDGWSVLSALSLGGGFFVRIASLSVLLAACVATSWWGSMSAAGHKRRIGGRSPGKNIEKAS